MIVNTMGDTILVKELKDDINQDGILVAYDDSNSFIFTKVISIPPKVKEELKDYGFEENSILVLSRIAKIPFINETYFVNKKDILGVMPEEEYIKYVRGG